jgi:hypothetical protein
MMDRWMVVLTGPELVEELRKIPDDKLSFDHAMRDVCILYYLFPIDTIDLHVRKNTQILQVKYTFGIEAQTHPYHVNVLQGQLKRKLGDIFPDIHREICQTFEEILHASELGEHYFLTVLRIRSNCNPIGWAGIPAYSAVMKATCRTSNRVFVGLPVCKSRFMPPQSDCSAPSVGQSPEFADVLSKFALQIMFRASLVNFFPKLMHP